MDQDIEFMKLAYNEALKALKLDEVPIGAIIVKDGEDIAKGHNLKETSQQATRHAEIIVIEEAEKKLNNWHLDDCILYTTLEPCLMCSGAIIQSRIKRVVFGASEKRWSCITSIINSENINHYPIIEGNVLEKECSMLISQYFRNKRL
jgi:tRNA(adenine34) deaminase